MPEYKTSNITDFFKPFAQPRQSKRPPPDEDIQQSQRSRKSRSTTPQTFPSSLPIRSCENTPSKRPTGIANASLNTTDTDPSKAKVPADPPDTSSCTLNPGQNLPLSSQGPIPSSSQRVVKNGEVVVTNSDDEGSDTDTSLGDIDELLRLRRQPPEQISSPLTEPDSSISTPSVRSSSGSEPEADITVHVRTRRRNLVNKQSSLRQSSDAPKYKFDLGSLVKRCQKDEACEEGIARARSLLATLERKDTSALAQDGGHLDEKRRVDADLITFAMKQQGDDSDTKRLMLAIERTEALEEDLSWSFFENDNETSDVHSEACTDAKPKSWHGALGDPMFRQQAMSRAAVGAIATNKALPDEIILWLFDAASLESRHDLRYSYVSTLKDAANDLAPLLNRSRIDAAFQKLGASTEALDLETPIRPVASTRSKNEHARRRPRLESMIQLLGDLAIHLDPNTRNHTICILCRLLLDHSIVRDSHALVALDEALNSLVDAMAGNDVEDYLQPITNMLFDTINEVTVRAQLIRNISPLSPPLTLLRRRLCLAFFFEEKNYLSKPVKDLVDLNLISRQLEASTYLIDKETNFTELAAAISILDAGLGSGDPPHPGINKAAEKEFNEHVDKISYKIRSISTSIVDTGASQLRRTEAKESLECFNFRLMYAVRTAPRTKNNRFMTENIKKFLEARQTKDELVSAAT